MSQTYQTLSAEMKRHSLYRSKCLNLIASENVISPQARTALAHDLGNRYTIGAPGKRLYGGCQYYDRIELMTITLAKKLFHARYVNVQPLSGMVANLVAYHALLEPDDLLMSLEVKNGGHYSHVQENMLKLFGVRVAPLPFDHHHYRLDLERTVETIRKRKPKVVLLGTSEFLFPSPIAALRPVCDRVGTKILYDAAHVSGLIAGRTFQNPLSEGADFLTMSTNKTLAAPDHGLVACNDENSYKKRIEAGVMPLFTSNHHPHHVAGLAVTLAEFEKFGHQYATRMIKNAQSLAGALYEQGLAVLCPQQNFTQSHTVLFDAKSPGHEATNLLEQANIIVNPFQLPWNSPGDETGVRLGTNEVSRLGMKEKEMKITAQFISDTLFRRRSPGKVKKDVIELRKHFQTIHYCFPPGRWDCTDT